jgi:DNA-binding CsgD family transcriptional regulator/PAS domain-containing protein
MGIVTREELTSLSEVVNHVYQAALNPSAWSVALSVMAKWLESPMAMLFTPTVLPRDGGFYFNHGIPEAAMELWQTQYQPLDIWTTTAIRHNRIQEGSVFTGEDLLPASELTQSVWYQEFLSKIGIGQVLVNIIYGLDSETHHPTVLSYFRGSATTEFGTYDRWRSALLLPHVSRAMGVALRLRNADHKLATSLTALDRLNHGVLLFGENEEVLFNNQAASRIFGLEDGLRLQKQGCWGRTYLAAKTKSAQEAMDEAIREAVCPNILSAQHFSKAVAVPRTSRHSAFTFSISSLPTRHGFAIEGRGNPRAIAFIYDNAVPVKVNHTLLKSMYGLTNAEIRVAELIVEGKSLEQISEKCGLSINTLKTHLSRTYEKTGMANRAMLVKLLVTLSQNA